MDDNGIKDELPPITTFLNRLLALTIELAGHPVHRLRAASDAGSRAPSPAASMMSGWRR
jgi:hypothetical protein